MNTIAIRLDPETKKKLEVISSVSKRSPSDIVAEAVFLFVKNAYDAIIEENENKVSKENTEVIQHWNLKI